MWQEIAVIIVLNKITAAAPQVTLQDTPDSGFAANLPETRRT